jgi:hypothetical protein
MVSSDDSFIDTTQQANSGITDHQATTAGLSGQLADLLNLADQTSSLPADKHQQLFDVPVPYAANSLFTAGVNENGGNGFSRIYP